MLTTPPDDFATWAASPVVPGDIDEPPAATQAAGWPAGIKPPHEWMNWLQNNFAAWTEHLGQQHAVFADLDTAVDFADTNLSSNDTLMVFEPDETTGPGISLASVASGASGPFGSIAVSGDLVVWVVGTGNPTAYNRDLDTLVATYARTNSGQNYSCLTDGTITVIGYDQYVEVFNALTGASLWIHDNTTPVGSMCMAGGFIYIVHDLSTGAGDATNNRQCHKLNAGTGAVVWSFQHSAAGGSLRSCCTNGRQLFVAGQVSDYATGATLRAIRCTDGFDATGEGNNGDADDGLAWDQVTSVHPAVDMLDCDGTMLYMGHNPTAAFQLEIRGQGDGEVRISVAHPDAAAGSLRIRVDQDYVLLTSHDGGTPAEGYLEAYDKRTGVLAWRYADESASPTPKHAAAIAAVSDGCAVYMLGDDDNFVRKISRGNTSTRFRVSNTATDLPRFQNLKLQPVGQ